MFQESIKVSLIAVTLEQLMYLFLTRCCLLSIPPRNLQRHPCPLGSENYLNKDGRGSKGPGTGIGKKKGFFFNFPPNFFWKLVVLQRSSMVEGTDTGWLTVLEKNGLRLAAEILENYGIDSETDLSVLDQDDFSKLASRGLKPKKLCVHVPRTCCLRR